MPFLASRNTTLDELIDLAIDHREAAINVCLPGKIQSYDPVKQMADIEILIKDNVVDTDNVRTEENYPLLREVPIMFPRAGEFFISFPLKPNDRVVVFFADRSLDNYMSSSSTSAVSNTDLRMHDISDAVAYPGLYPFPNSLPDVSGSEMVFGKSNSIQIKVNDSDQVKVTLSGRDEEPAVLGEQLKDYINELVLKLNDHVHSTAFGPSGIAIPSGQGLTNDYFSRYDEDNINSNNVKLPGN